VSAEISALPVETQSVVGNLVIRIDSHHHLWDLSAVSYPWLEARGQHRFFGDPTPIQRNYLVGEFRGTATRHGMDASVHIQVGADDGMTEARWVDAVAAANPGWPAAQVAFADLTLPELEDCIDELLQLPSVRGVRQIVGRSPEEDASTGTHSLLNNSRFPAGLKQICDAGLSFDLQLLPELMDATARILAHVPDPPVAVCHAGSPHDRSREGLDYWSREIRKLAENPNVYCKLSGLGMFERNWTIDKFRPIIETCMELFGPSRCMFGSNFPVDSLHAAYSELVAAHAAIVPDSSRDDVFGGTARRFYRLNSNGN